MHFYNVHTHHRAQAADESVLRNAYLYAPYLQPVTYALSAGLHPWFIQGDMDAVRESLETALRNPQVKALGECGLDRLKGPPFEIQYRFLQMQRELAEASGKPMIIHCVRAYDEIREQLKDAQVPVILHDHRASLVQTRRLLHYPHFYFSLGKGLLNDSAKYLQACAAIPPERVLFETDTLRMPVQKVYERYAQLFSFPLEKLAATTESALYGIWPAGL
ncbi:MAG: TatD family hydrolase [Bacteroidia bacterium]|nr:TatD family hydrolase [Bacteroidia bacterium]